MKIRIWLVTRERETWIAGAEILGLAALLVVAIEAAWAQLLGLALLAHLGYTALTGLPMGRIPGRPPGRQARRNLDLREQVTSFLREVRRVDEYAQRARGAGWRGDEMEATLRAGEQRVMAAAARVAEATCRPTGEDAGTSAGDAALAAQRTRTTQSWRVGLKNAPEGERTRIAVEGRLAPETRK